MQTPHIQKRKFFYIRMRVKNVILVLQFDCSYIVVLTNPSRPYKNCSTETLNNAFALDFPHDLLLFRWNLKDSLKMGFPRKSDEICIPCCTRVCKVRKNHNYWWKPVRLNLGTGLIAILTNFWKLAYPCMCNDPIGLTQKDHLNYCLPVPILPTAIDSWGLSTPIDVESELADTCQHPPHVALVHWYPPFHVSESALIDTCTTLAPKNDKFQN